MGKSKEMQMQLREREQANEGAIPVLRSTTEGINIYNDASKLTVATEEQDKLLASFDAKEIEIRPDGLIYLPQAFWRKRLNTSFGIGQWCIISKGTHQDDNRLYFNGVLMVRGCYVAEAVGEAEYHATNSNMSWASVWESAKSDCITRCCKDLGIASELWQPEFINSWIEQNAVQAWRGETKKFNRNSKQWEPGCFQWRKKTGKPFYDEKSNGQTAQAPAPKKDQKRTIKWLSEDQLKATLASDQKGITATLNHYSKDGRGMKKEYREQLNQKLAELKKESV